MNQNKQTNFEYSIYDKDVGVVLNTKTFTNVKDLFNNFINDLRSYDGDDKEYMDEDEIKEAKYFNVNQISGYVLNIINNPLFPLFGEFGIWFPGHHRMIKITCKQF